MFYVRKHDVGAYFGKKFIVFDLLRNPAPIGYEIRHQIRHEIRHQIRHGNHYENKNWNKIMNVCPLVVKQILGRL